LPCVRWCAAERATFVASFEADVAASLGLPATRVLVQNVRAASVAVTFAVLADTTGTAVELTALQVMPIFLRLLTKSACADVTIC
jgi:hypothetical protein